MNQDSDGGVGDDVGSDADVSTGTTFAFGVTNNSQLSVLSIRSRDGLLVILAFVRQQGLYPPVEAVPPKPSSLFRLHLL